MDNAVFLTFGHEFGLRYTRNELFENIFIKYRSKRDLQNNRIQV